MSPPFRSSVTSKNCVSSTAQYSTIITKWKTEQFSTFYLLKSHVNVQQKSTMSQNASELLYVFTLQHSGPEYFTVTNWVAVSSDFVTVPSTIQLMAKGDTFCSQSLTSVTMIRSRSYTILTTLHCYLLAGRHSLLWSMFHILEVK